MLETLNQALDRIDTYKFTGKGSLYGWISRIAINKAIHQIRKQRWRTVPLDYWARDNIPEPTEDEMEADGYSHQEIAKMLGITETGSTSILAKARKQLKDKIKRYLKEQDQ